MALTIEDSALDLDPLDLDAAHLGVMVAGAEAAGVHKQLAHVIDADVRESRDGPHRSAFAEHREDLGALSNVSLFMPNSVKNNF